MRTDFDKPTDRFGTLSYKWDIAEGELPMWVADMDFEVAEPIRLALEDRAKHGIFGYSYAPCEFFEAVSGYWERRHGYRIPTEWMVYSNGVVASISSIVRRLTEPAESVLIMAPVYNIFYNSILNNGRAVLSSDLVYERGEYRIDFSDLEEKLSRPSTSLMILCNPHNPVGKIWSREELEKIAELCYENGVKVISDEIHCDIVAPGREYVPFMSVSESARDISVTLISGSKTFNIAGLQSSVAVVKNPHLRFSVYRGLNNDEVGEPNCFSMCANIKAFTECDFWVDAMREYVFSNKSLVKEYVDKKIKGLSVVSGEATYLVWIDISAVSHDSVEFCKRLRESTGLYLSDGAEYGECGRAFVRMNVATQLDRVKDGLERLRAFVEEYSDNR